MNKTNLYGHTFTVRCPNNDDTVEYTLMVLHDEMIMVEDIIDACRFPAAYQEDIADALREKLPGRISISAVHQGVEVVTLR